MKAAQKSIAIVTTAHTVGDPRVFEKFAVAFRDNGFRVLWVGPEFSGGDKARLQEGGIEGFLYKTTRRRARRVLNWIPTFRIARRLGAVDWLYCPDPDSAPIGVALRGRLGSKVIFDIHELYSADGLKSFGFGPLIAPVAWVGQRCLRFSTDHADIVMTVGETLRNSYHLDPRKAMVVRSCAPRSFHAGGKAPPAEGTPMRIMHGKAELNLARGTNVLLRALSLLKSRECVAKVMVIEPPGGPFADSVRAAGVGHLVDIRPPVRMPEMKGLLAECEAGMVLYSREMALNSMPNRLFEYLASGLAVVMPSCSTEAMGILKAEDCGVGVDSDDPEDVARAIQWLCDNRTRCWEMGRRGMDAFLARHNWEAEFGRVLTRMDEVA